MAEDEGISIDAAYNESEYLSLLDAALTGGVDPHRVTSVDLSGNKINPSICNDISWKYISQFTHLTSLDMKANTIGPEGWEALYAAITTNRTFTSSLLSLDLSENSIFDEGLYQVAKLLVEAKALRSLALVTNSITPRGIPTLCDGLAHASSLSSLTIDYNNLGDEGVAMLVPIVERLPHLRVLGLSDNSIGDAGARSLCTYIIGSSNCRVEHLNLSCNQIGDDGLCAIAAALQKKKSSTNSRFQYLDLSCNRKCTTVGLTQFTSTAKYWSTLNTVELCSMELAASHLRSLTEAIRSPQSALCYVEYFINPDVTLEAEQELALAIDSCAKPLVVDKQVTSIGRWGLLGVGAAIVGVVAIVVALRGKAK